MDISAEIVSTKCWRIRGDFYRRDAENGAGYREANSLKLFLRFFFQIGAVVTPSTHRHVKSYNHCYCDPEGIKDDGKRNE